MVNLFNQLSLAPAERRRVQAECLERLQQLCRLYGGSADLLAGTGAVAVLDVPEETANHAFQAICAAQLARRLTADLNRARAETGRTPLVVRLGLERADVEEERAASGAGVAAAMPRSVQHAVLLSALGRDDCVVIGERVHASCAEPERIGARPVESPALRAPDGSAPRSAWLVRELPESYRQLLDRQAGKLLARLARA